MSSSVTNLRPVEIGARERGLAPLVLVTGGKGGVGKTTIATNLGVQLARNGKRVLLADLDLGLSNVDVMLRLSPGRTIEDALEGRCRFEDCVIDGPSGLKVLPAGSGSMRMARLDEGERMRILQAVRELSRRYDLVIGDSAAGIGHEVLGLAAAADHVLAVTTPLPAALTDAYGLIKALDQWGRERGLEVPTPELVINQVSGLEEAERTATRLKAVCQRFLCRAPRLTGWLPNAPRIARSGTEQKPFALGGSNSLVSNCLQRLAARVSRLIEPAGRGFGA